MNRFENENEFCRYIEHNIVVFCSKYLQTEYKSHIREETISKTRRRIDFLIVDVYGNRIGVEVKHPAKKTYNLPAVIGQSLDYLISFENEKNALNRMVIVSSAKNQNIELIISKYNLPLEYIIINGKPFTSKKREENIIPVTKEIVGRISQMEIDNELTKMWA